MLIAHVMPIMPMDKLYIHIKVSIIALDMSFALELDVMGRIHYSISLNYKYGRGGRVLFRKLPGFERRRMVHCCCVPGCTDQSDSERHLSYFGLLLKNKSLLKQWKHRIGRNNLPTNGYTRICSAHFVRAAGRRLRSDEVPSVNLPVLATSVTKLTPRRPPRERVYATLHNDVENSGDDGPSSRKDVATQVDYTGAAPLSSM